MSAAADELEQRGALEVRELTVRYPARDGAGGAVQGIREGSVRVAAESAAIDSVSFQQQPGEVIALLGASGSGKSTLLRAIAGLEELAGGRVLWNGRDIAGIPAHRRGFVLMFQDGQLFDHRSVAGNVEYPLELSGMARAERSARSGELLALVGLAGFGPRRIGALSGGERQRVALARALAASPRLLLLDEPLSALDRQLRARLGQELADILAERSLSSIVVTHDQEEAFRLADRVGVLVRGRLVQLDTPERLRQAPATPEVAAFLGVGEQ